MVFSHVSDVFEDFFYAVRFPGWPSGPAAGPSAETAANLHFSKEFQRFPVVPQLQSVFFFSAALSARPDGAVFSDVSDVFEDFCYAVRFSGPSFFFCKRLRLVFPLFFRDSEGFFFSAICCRAPWKRKLFPRYMGDIQEI